MALTLAPDAEARRVARAMRAAGTRFLVLTTEGRIDDRNEHGKATPWAFRSRAVADRHARRRAGFVFDIDADKIREAR